MGPETWQWGVLLPNFQTYGIKALHWAPDCSIKVWVGMVLRPGFNPSSGGWERVALAPRTQSWCMWVGGGGIGPQGTIPVQGGWKGMVPGPKAQFSLQTGPVPFFWPVGPKGSASLSYSDILY